MANTKLLLVVTGASRGLGRAIAKVFCDNFPKQVKGITDIKVILLARSQQGLQETQELILRQQSSTADGDGSVNIACETHAVDLGNLDNLDAHLDRLLEGMKMDLTGASARSRLVFINNAGTLGHLGPCIDSPSLKEMRANVDLNVTSALWTSVRFARFVSENVAAESDIATTIVNISSLAAIQVFPTMGMYAAGKAARDHYHATLAQEINATTSSNIKLLNYAPGPLETDMATELRAADALSKDLKPHFEKQLVDPNDSAKKLVKLVAANEFESGTHIDYYDLP